MAGRELLRRAVALACCVGFAPLAHAQSSTSAGGSEPSLPSFLDKRHLPNLTLPPAGPGAPAASDVEEETRRRAEELSKKFSNSAGQPAGGDTRGQGSAIGAGGGHPPVQGGGSATEEALRRELEAATQRAVQAEARARKEEAARSALEAESREALEQAAAAVAKAQDEVRQAERRVAEAEKRAERAQEQLRQKTVGFKPPAAPTADGRSTRQAGGGYQAVPRPSSEARPPPYEDSRAPGLLGLGAGRPVK
jgi:hypothetical protein